MGRTAREKRTPYVRPVEKIELSEKNVKKRFFAAIIFLAVGVFLLVMWFMSFLSAEKGWTAITAYKSDNADCGGEFVFQYDLGRDGVSASAESKAVTAQYTAAVQKAYRLFNEDEAFPDTVNVYSINRHPNEELEIDETLYKAFALLDRYKARWLYMAPVYVRWDDLFYCADESGFADFDPRLSDDVRQEYAGVSEYANDPESVDIKLLGNNRIKLYVSEEYLEYAKSEEITDFIGFYWLKNAFIADYIADTMISAGFTHGVISSYDGFTRNLDGGDTDYSQNIFNKRDNIYQAGVVHYKGEMSIVNYRSYPMNSLDAGRFYRLENGETRSAYLDLSDGYCKNALSELTCFSETKSCAETVLETAPLYIAETPDTAALAALSEKNIYSVYCDGLILVCDRNKLEIGDLYDDGKVSYSTEMPQNGA